MEFCVWCRQPVYAEAWGHGNGKKLYVRSDRGFEAVGAVHYYCKEEFPKMRAEMIAHQQALREAVESLHEMVQARPETSISTT